MLSSACCSLGTSSGVGSTRVACTVMFAAGALELTLYCTCAPAGKPEGPVSAAKDRDSKSRDAGVCAALNLRIIKLKGSAKLLSTCFLTAGSYIGRCAALPLRPRVAGMQLQLQHSDRVAESGAVPPQHASDMKWWHVLAHL